MDSSNAVQLTSDSPVSISGVQRKVLESHPKYKIMTDAQLLAEVRREVPGIVSRKTNQFVLPVISIVNGETKINRAVAIAVLVGTLDLNLLNVKMLG